MSRARKHSKDAVIHACVGVEVIPHGPPEGDLMGNGRVEMAVREVKRQCRTLRISAEQNSSVRITDDSPLLNWILRFAAQVPNKMRIGKDGKTSEMRRTGRRWREPVAQRGLGSVKFGEDGVGSFASRTTQEIIVGHHDRTGAVLCIGQEWRCARQKLDSTDIEWCLGIDELGRFVWYSVADGGSN